jgi:ElaB/YqjD/DUF883 family membrane-anchored ribosome-binding protein
MSKSIAKKIHHDVDHTIEDVAHILRKAADTLSGDAEEAVAVAAAALRAAADRVVEITPEPAKDAARRAAQEVKAHPIASAAAALTAAAALISLLAAARKKAA